MKSKIHALVVLSGGQDSVTCLGFALQEFEKVSAISFVYGQRHEVELQCAAHLCQKYHVPHKLVDLSFIGGLVTSALTGKGEVGKPHAYKAGLPSSFVPNRNAFFLTAAHAHAQEIGAGVLITGVCQTDYSGYPDCRNIFIEALQSALNLGYETGIAILTPLMWLTKAQTWELAEQVGFLDEVIKHSHTCYNGDHTTKHDWGYGCGTCPACELRKKGYEEFIASKERKALDILDNNDKAMHLAGVPPFAKKSNY
jgi:7-cyano-7-deazaguanine synthase